MIKKTVFTFVLAALLGATGYAQRIAYCDVTDILQSIPEYQKAQQQLDKIATEWRQEIAVKQDEIKAKYSKFQAEKVLLNEDMVVKQEEEIMAMEKQVRELQRNRFGPEGDLFKKRSELVRPIQERVYNTISRFAEDKGFDFIFDKGSASGMLFGNERYDKTEDIKDMLKRG